jgi:hypothetical protein
MRTWRLVLSSPIHPRALVTLARLALQLAVSTLRTCVRTRGSTHACTYGSRGSKANPPAHPRRPGRARPFAHPWQLGSSSPAHLPWPIAAGLCFLASYASCEGNTSCPHHIKETSICCSSRFQFSQVLLKQYLKTRPLDCIVQTRRI